MPGTPSIWNGTSRPCQWIEVSSSRVLATDRRTFWPSRRRSRGAGKTPLTVTACPVRPPTVNGVCPTVRSMFGPVSVGRSALKPSDPVCAQAGSSPCRPSRPPPATAPRRSVRRSRRGIDIGEKFLGRLSSCSFRYAFRRRIPCGRTPQASRLRPCAPSRQGEVKRLCPKPLPGPPPASYVHGRSWFQRPWT